MESNAVWPVAKTQAALKDHLAQVLGEELNDRDKALLMGAEQLIRHRYKNGRRHLAACAWGVKRAEMYISVQINTKRAREASVCAEAGVILQAELEDDEILTVVTFHGNHNGTGKCYIVAPCPLCIMRLQRFAPASWVILEHNGVHIKIPYWAAAQFAYPKEDHKD